VGAAQNLDLIRAVTKRWMPLGQRVAILGGGLVGVELAEFLRERDREVTVIEEGPDLAPEMAMPRRWRILYELREHGVRLMRNTRVMSIGPKSVEVVGESGESGPSGEMETVPADSVILAIGTRANLELAESLESAGCEIHTIGDASGVGYIDGAMRDAARTARAI
jgi:pyruvate/2-oxoglutarate dehydrogenase complex dihydrolipoamide dehydrogenase (E3) component